MSKSAESTVPPDYQYDDVQAVAAYRGISPMAVLALVLGLASPLAVFNHFLLILPILGTIVALLAIRRIAASEGELAGRRLALAGLALAVVCATALLTRDAVSKQVVAGQAAPWAEEWCRLVMADRHEAALELTRPLETRRAIDQSLLEYYQTNENAKQELAKFRESEVVQLLTEAGEDARIVPAEVQGLVRDARGNFTLLQNFRLESSGDGAGPASRAFQLQLRKSGPTSPMPGVWHVSNFVLAP